jgi:T5SS/PEP-CTERM-associated repeat protein
MKTKFTSETDRKLTRQVILLTIAALAVSTSTGSRAEELCNCQTTWIGSTGDWFTQSNWSSTLPDCGGGSCIIGGATQGEINGGTAQISSTTQTAYACALTLGVNTNDSGRVSVNHGTLTMCGEIFVGSNGRGGLTITNGGVVNMASAGASIASFAGSHGSVTVDGVNQDGTKSQLAGSGPIYLGGTIDGPGGDGLLTVTNSATVTATNIHVYPSGTLTGNSTVTVTTTSGTTVEGTLEPSSGRLTIGGNLTFFGTAPVMQSNVVPASADNVYVSSGAATLTGKLKVRMTGTFTPGTTYTLLHCDSPRNGTFSSVSITYPTDQCFTPVITYDANNVYLNLVSCD